MKTLFRLMLIACLVLKVKSAKGEVLKWCLVLVVIK